MIVSGIGLALVAVAIVLWNFNSGLTFNYTALAIGGVILVIVGILIFVADFFETFLSRGQTVLVDGLQAG